MKIKDCNFTAVKWDGKAIESVDKVAQALLNLTELFKTQDITIDTMVRINPIPPIDIKNERGKKWKNKKS